MLTILGLGLGLGPGLAVGLCVAPGEGDDQTALQQLLILLHVMG